MLEVNQVALSMLWPAVAIQFVCTAVVLPLAVFRATRAFTGKVLRFFSYMLGLTTWIWGFSVTYLLWGGWAVAIGILLLGVGVVPLAFVAAGFEGWWLIVGQMALTIVLVFGTRAAGAWMIESAELSR